MLQALLVFGRADDQTTSRSTNTPISARRTALSRARSIRPPVPQQRTCPAGSNGFATTQLTVDQIVPLPGPGLIVGTTTLTAKHDALQAFIAATLRAMD